MLRRGIKVDLDARERRLLCLMSRHAEKITREDALVRETVANRIRCEASLRKVPEGIAELSLSKNGLWAMLSECSPMKFELGRLHHISETLRLKDQLVQQRSQKLKLAGYSDEEIAQDRKQLLYLTFEDYLVNPMTGSLEEDADFWTAAAYYYYQALGDDGLAIGSFWDEVATDFLEVKSAPASLREEVDHLENRLLSLLRKK